MSEFESGINRSLNVNGGSKLESEVKVLGNCTANILMNFITSSCCIHINR